MSQPLDPRENWREHRPRRLKARRTTEAATGGPSPLFGGLVWLTLLGYALFVAALLAVDLSWARRSDFAAIFARDDLRAALWLTLRSATLSTVLAVATALPVAYALSRWRFPGRALLDALVDVPIVLPPVVAGLSLLVACHTPWGQAFERHVVPLTYAPAGIVLAMWLVVSAFAIRTLKSTFDTLDPRLESVARTLGWSRGGAFLHVAVPLARRGVVAAAVLAWAHAVGLFGPLLVFAGATRGRTEVVSTAVYTELSVGNIEGAMAISLLLVALSCGALLVFKQLGGSTRHGH